MKCWAFLLRELVGITVGKRVIDLGAGGLCTLTSPNLLDTTAHVVQSSVRTN